MASHQPSQQQEQEKDAAELRQQEDPSEQQQRQRIVPPPAADAAAAAPAAANGAAAADAADAPDAPDADTLLPVLDPVSGAYEKLHRVGEGTYGVVYKARHAPTGRTVALKRVRFAPRGGSAAGAAGAAAAAAAAARGEGVPVTSVREVRALQQCRGHPTVVALERVVTGARADSVFLVFEYAAHDLGRLLDAMPAPFSESEVKCLARQLLQAVAFLHDRALMHRDIKVCEIESDGDVMAMVMVMASCGVCVCVVIRCCLCAVFLRSADSVPPTHGCTNHCRHTQLSNLLYTSSGELKLCDFGLAR